MATSIHTASTSTGLGSWVQAGANPTYIRVVVTGSDADAQLTIVSSETNGPGIGSSPSAEETVIAPGTPIDEAVMASAGKNYLNARIDRIEGDTTVHVEAVN